jgi:flavin reductase (DIM6/NTAB) family NADH-FMN oxidoreductase RutF
MVVDSESLKNAMRKWTTGVSIVTSRDGNLIHGMTVNSFTSISIAPPLVVVTLAHPTRTYSLVLKTGLFGVTILGSDQEEISARFSGKGEVESNRFENLSTFEIVSGVPFLSGGLAFFDCRVQRTYPMTDSTLFIAEVTAVQIADRDDPLVYHNRQYHRLGL